MQAKLSTGNDCLWFPHVTDRNSPAPTGNLHEAFIVPVRADLFKPRDVSLYPASNNSTNVITCRLWSQWYTLQSLFCSKKNWTVPCWLFKPLSKKHSSLKKSSLPSKWSGTGCCHFFGFFLSSYRVKEKS